MMKTFEEISTLLSPFKKVPIFLSPYEDKKIGTKWTVSVGNEIFYTMKLGPTFTSCYNKDMKGQSI